MKKKIFGITISIDDSYLNYWPIQTWVDSTEPVDMFLVTLAKSHFPFVSLLKDFRVKTINYFQLLLSLLSIGKKKS